MKDEISERADIVTKIIHDKLNYSQVENQLNELEKKYGDKAFLKYPVTKKVKPWDKKYYDDLKLKAAIGAGSKEFILHLAEVKDYLKRKQMIKKLVIAGGCVASAALVAVVIISIVRGA